MRLTPLGLAIASFAMSEVASSNPQARIAVGAGAGSPPRVVVYDGDTPAFDFLAYGASFMGGVRVALGDVNADGVADVVTAPAAGTGQRVQVFDGVTGLESWGFYPFTSFHTTGIFVAAGDVNGDGRADVVAGADAGGASRVKVYDGDTRMAIADFVAFDPSFTGGVRVAAGDVNGDGRADLVLGSGAGAGQVRILDADGIGVLADFQPFGAGFTHGVFVAAGDVDGDGRAEPVVAPDENPNGEWRIIVYDTDELGAPEPGWLAVVEPFMGFDGGVRVATGYIDTDGLTDLLFGPGPSPPLNGPLFALAAGEAPVVRRLRGFDQLDLGDLAVLDASVTGGVFVAAAAIPAPEPHAAALAVGLCYALRSGRRGTVARRSQ